MSLIRAIQTARQALMANTSSLNITGENIANANTDGFVRRKVNLRTESSFGPNAYAINPPYGAGVQVQSIERVTDQLLMRSAREAQSGFEGASERHRLLTALESMVGTTAGSTLSDSAHRFFDQWSALSSNPRDPGVRNAVLGSAQTLVDHVNTLATRTNEFELQVKEDLTRLTSRANSLIERFGLLNESIMASRGQGMSDLASEDERDRVVGELAKLLPVSVRMSDNGSATLLAGSLALADGTHTTPLRLDEQPGQPLRLLAGEQSLSTQDGQIGAQFTLLRSDLPTYRQDLNQFVQALVTQVNDFHSLGFDAQGNSGQPFFDPAGLEAGSLRLSVTSANGIAARSQTSDNGVAQQISGLRESLVRASDTVLTRIGMAAGSARTESDSQRTVALHLDALVSSVQKVSVDEELALLIRHQQAYNASARVLTTAQSMMDTLLSL